MLVADQIAIGIFCFIILFVLMDKFTLEKYCGIRLFKGFCANVLASILILVASFYFRDFFWKWFGKPRIAQTQLSCGQALPEFKPLFIYDCRIKFENSFDQEINNKTAVTTDFESYFFPSCDPKIIEISEKNSIIPIPQKKEGTCKFKVKLEGHSYILFSIRLNSGEEEPKLIFFNEEK